MSDPAGWYPDPTTRHELRYWDGYAWLDNVSDSGAAAVDPLGGKPMPAPSDAAAKAQQGPLAAAKSKTPLYIGGAVVAAVIIVVAALLVTRSGGDGGSKVSVLGDQPATFADDGKDPSHPTVHTVRLKGNQVVLITVTSDDDTLAPGVIAEAPQNVVDQVNNQIEDASSVLESQFKDACRNLREEDLGVQGSVVYFFGAGDAGTASHFFVFAPVAGDFEFVAVLVDDESKCEGGKLTMTLRAVPVDMTTASNIQDLQDLAQDNPTISEFLSS